MAQPVENSEEKEVEQKKSKPKIGVLQNKRRDVFPTGLNAPDSPIKPPKRFNELDVKILEDTAAVEVDELAFKLELRMNTILKEIQLIEDSSAIRRKRERSS